MDDLDLKEGGHQAQGHDTQGRGEDASQDYDASVERKYLPRRIAPAWFAGVGALALAGGFALLSALRVQNMDLSAPPRLPHKIHPAATPIPAPPPLPTASPDQEAALTNIMQRADAWAQGTITAPPQPSLIVCEPAVDSSGAKGAQAFADGCARWLHFNASGEPNMGATPLWHRVEYARLSMADSRRLARDKRVGFRPGAGDVAALYRATGAARIALGHLQTSGSAAPEVLSYQVWDAPSGRLLATFKTSGTRGQIAQQLPSLARSLNAAASTYKGALEIPARCELSAPDLEAVGSAPWSAWDVGSKGEAASGAQVRALEKLAPRSALAALEVLFDYPYTFGDARYNAAQGHLLRLAPRNALAWSGASCLNAMSLHGRQRDLDQLRASFPSNAALCMAQAYGDRMTDHPRQAYRWAGRALRLAPLDPVCWRATGHFAGDEADKIRQGRYSSQISRSEWDVLNRWYEISLLCQARAASLDGRDGRTWAFLCTAATFANEDDLAQGALWHGLALDPENSELCSWALQLLQPKWTRHSDLLPQMITHIECTRPLFESLHEDAIHVLTNAEGDNNLFKDMGQQMLNRTVSRLQDEARQQPQRPEPHYELAYCAKRFGLAHTQDGTAVREFGLYLKLRPWDAYVHYSLAWTLQHKTGQLQEAQREYEAALSIKPEFPDALSDYAELLMARPRDVASHLKAASLLKRAMVVQDEAYYHVQLGRLLLDAGDTSGARREAQTALAMGYKDQDRLFKALNLNPAPGSTDAPDESEAPDEKPGLNN